MGREFLILSSAFFSSSGANTNFSFFLTLQVIDSLILLTRYHVKVIVIDNYFEKLTSKTEF